MFAELSKLKFEHCNTLPQLNVQYWSYKITPGLGQRYQRQRADLCSKHHWEANDLICLGLEPETIQCLIQNKFVENGPNNFVGLLQLALYVEIFWDKTCIEEATNLCICHIQFSY